HRFGRIAEIERVCGYTLRPELHQGRILHDLPEGRCFPDNTVGRISRELRFGAQLHPSDDPGSRYTHRGVEIAFANQRAGAFPVEGLWNAASGTRESRRNAFGHDHSEAT